MAEKYPALKALMEFAEKEDLPFELAALAGKYDKMSPLVALCRIVAVASEKKALPPGVEEEIIRLVKNGDFSELKPMANDALNGTTWYGEIFEWVP